MKVYQYVNFDLGETLKENSSKIIGGAGGAIAGGLVGGPAGAVVGGALGGGAGAVHDNVKNPVNFMKDTAKTAVTNMANSSGKALEKTGESFGKAAANKIPGPPSV